MKKQWATLWINGTIITCTKGYGLIHHGAIAATQGKIAWVGAMQALPERSEKLAEHVIDLEGRCLTPGLIDCHTHVVYAGNRAHEFEQRLHGVSYADIARRGGGIQSTVTATRNAAFDTLLAESLPRVQMMLQNGATTIEIKSGYGLDLATELMMLRVAKRIGELLPITVRTTFLGAHTVPTEYRNNADRYIDVICNEMIPAIAREKLADSVDVFCETIAFNVAQTERVFAAAQQHGLTVKCHAEQLSNSGATALAVKYQALSVDHLEHLSPAGISALAKSNTVAVLLPGAFYYVREKQLPPLEQLREHNIPIALATDCNPGTSPILSLPLILNMACTLFRLTPEEAWLGVTQHAARALGIADEYGSLTIGKAADFAIWNVAHPVDLCYYLGGSFLQQLVKAGNTVL